MSDDILRAENARLRLENQRLRKQLSEYHQREEARRQNIRRGLDAAITKGKRLGRPPGSVPEETMFEAHADIVNALYAGKSVRQIAAETGRAASTVQRVSTLLKGTPAERQRLALMSLVSRLISTKTP